MILILYYIVQWQPLRLDQSTAMLKWFWLNKYSTRTVYTVGTAEHLMFDLIFGG